MEFSTTDTTGVFLPLVYFFPEPTQFMIYVTAQTKLNSVFVMKYASFYLLPTVIYEFKSHSNSNVDVYHVFLCKIVTKKLQFLAIFWQDHTIKSKFDHSKVPRPSWRNDISYFSSTPERESIFIRRVTLLLGEVMTHCLCHNPIPWPPRPLIRIRRSFWPGRSYLPPAAVKNKRCLCGRTLMEWYYEG